MQTLTEGVPRTRHYFNTIHLIESNQTHPIVDKSFVIGRSITCAIRLDDPTISKEHAEVRCIDGIWTLRDLSTKNGTYLNGIKIETNVIPHDNIIQLGRIKLKLTEKAHQKSITAQLIGEQLEFKKVVQMATMAARTELPILLLGETGSGKELFARLIHDHSARRSNEFVAVNCGAIPTSLIFSEFYGFKKGAFTDAKNNHMGVFEQAGQGSLFLDEIADLPIVAQPVLLRALEEKNFRPLGADRLATMHCRIISATNRFDLLESGAFRQDLYFRLGAVVIKIPPLRERKKDIPLLIKYFLDLHKKKLGTVSLPDKIIDKMISHPWPGNVRQLKNTCAQLALYGPHWFYEKDNTSLSHDVTQRHSKKFTDRDKTLYNIFKHACENHNSIRAAAAYLGIPRSTFAARAKLFKLNCN